MKRIYINTLEEHIEKEVTIFGWIDIRRDHGKLIFLDLRDVTGKVQMVVLPNHTEAIATASTLRNEWVVEVKGIVNKRPERMCKKGLNGNIEIEVTSINVLNESLTPPFDVTNNTKDIDEEVRLEYRYLDLRSERMKNNILTRSIFVQTAREYLFEQSFNEIETPLLTESTPEGSRDFVVPSRLQPGKFYALPQSPQQYKQLLMTAGFDKYFQTARAVRDEDLRADRGFEHTQIDLEMSFVNQEEILSIIEGMMVAIAKKLGREIREVPFPRITYKDAMEKYGDDKFDMRTKEEKEAGILAYAWVVDFPFFEKTDEGSWTFTHNPFSMPKEEDLEKLMEGRDIESIRAQQYDLVCNGFEAGGGSIRAHKPEILRATYKIMGYSDEQIDKNIGHLLKAFSHGAPPHGGIALGVERGVMNMTGEDTLRDVQAFPMTRGGKTSVMNAPASLNDNQLKELGIEIRKK